MKRFLDMRRRLTLFIVLLLLAAPVSARAQRVTPRDSAAAPDTVPKRVKPGTAFLRSLILPGWGQISVHAYNRAAIFASLQGASWYMLVKTINKLSDAHKLQDSRIAFVTDTLRAKLAATTDTAFKRRLSNPDTFNIVVNAQDTVKAAKSLINSREQQRQDWITYTLFTTLASGVDAFVAAHLADFPATITTRREVSGAYQLKVTVPFPRK